MIVLAVFLLDPIAIGARMVPLLLEPTEADALGAGYENDLLPAPREG